MTSPFSRILLSAALLPLVAGLSGEPRESSLRNIVVEHNQPATMRDGVTLYADVYRPEGPGRFPALLMRTPYGKESTVERAWLPLTVAAVRRGYVVVVQDTRGQHASEGRFLPYVQEINDGHDAIEWAARLPYVDGQVGTFGLSYPGAVQWMTAPTQPPSLKAIAPSMTFANQNHFVYHGGAFEVAFINWLLGRQIRERQLLGLPFTSPDEIAVAWGENRDRWMAHTPLRDLPLMRAFPYWTQWVESPIESSYWEPFNIEAQHPRVNVPALNITGWNDSHYGQPGAIRNFRGMRERGGTEAARRGQKLLIGPWTHGVPPPGRTTYAAVDYGPNAATDYAEPHLRFFDYWLKGIDEGYSAEAPVRIFVMGDNRWRDEREWPPARTQYQEWHLASDGHLSRDAATGPATMQFIYDPNDPAAAPWLAKPGDRDWRSVTARRDVLTFTSAPFARDVEITGHIVAKLWVSSTAPDTDITARALVVDPEGAASVLTAAPGVLRVRYRSTEDPQPPQRLVPGVPVELTISLGYTSQVLRAGQRLQVFVTGSLLQGIDIHPNTWEPFVSPDQAVRATQTLHMSGQHLSRIIVPTIPR